MDRSSAERRVVQSGQGRAPWANDQAAVEIATQVELLHEEPGHDRFAGARIVGEQEPERLPREHRFVDCRDLVRQRIDIRAMNCQVGVKVVREPDSLGFGGEACQGRIGIEAPLAMRLCQLQERFVMPVQHSVVRSAFSIPVDNFE